MEPCLFCISSGAYNVSVNLYVRMTTTRFGACASAAKKMPDASADEAWTLSHQGLRHVSNNFDVGRRLFVGLPWRIARRGRGAASVLFEDARGGQHHAHIQPAVARPASRRLQRCV